LDTVDPHEPREANPLRDDELPNDFAETSAGEPSRISYFQLTSARIAIHGTQRHARIVQMIEKCNSISFRKEYPQDI